MTPQIRNLAGWLARPVPRAECLRVLHDSEPSTQYDPGFDAAEVAAAIITDARAVADERGSTVMVRCSWIGAGDREIAGRSVVVGSSDTADVRTDATPQAVAHNAARHVEAMVRMMVTHTSALERSWRELAEAQQRARLEAESEARQLRQELRAKRDELEGRETEEAPSKVEEILTTLALQRLQGGAPAAGVPGAPAEHNSGS